MYNCIYVQGRRTGFITVYVFKVGGQNVKLYKCSGKEDRMYNCICVQGTRTGCIINCICVQGRRTGCIIVYVFREGGQDE